MVRITFLILALSLCACTPINSCQYRRAVCNELRSQLVLSGATSITRQQEIERAAAPLEQRCYLSYNCECAR